MNWRFVGQPTATDIRKELGLDAGYVSRMLRDFQTPEVRYAGSSPRQTNDRDSCR